MRRALASEVTRSAVACLAVLSTLLLQSCSNVDAVSKFCSSAQESLTAGDALFADFQGSCLRDASTFLRLGTFDANATSTGDATTGHCDYLAQQKALQATTGVLTGYLQAVDNLAAFGSAALGENTANLASQSVAAKLDANGAAAVQSLTSLLTHVAAAHYQTRHLDKDIKEANQDVAAITAALKNIVQDRYLPLLDKEQSDLSIRYRDMLGDNPCPGETAQPVDGTPQNLPATKLPPGQACHLEAVLFLQDRWQHDLETLNKRRQAASDFMQALDTIASGHATLAKNASHHLRGKDLPGLLSPYSADLQTLASSIEKLL